MTKHHIPQNPNINIPPTNQKQNTTLFTQTNPNSNNNSMRASNHLVGLVNFLTFLISIIILGGGIWLATRASATDCLRFLQWPIIILGAAAALVSLSGFAGACCRNTFLMQLYLWAMFFIITALIGFVIFAFVVTAKGSGRAMYSRAYADYYLQDYSGWLADRVAQPNYWSKIAACVRDSGVCGGLHRQVNGAPETVATFYSRKLSPIQSGCCKPPTECGYTYVNETTWALVSGVTSTSNDCSLWSNNQASLCYACDSCKAGVLASIKMSWRKVSIVNIIVIIILVIFYVVAYTALRNDKRMDNDEVYGETRMSKTQPSWIQF